MNRSNKNMGIALFLRLTCIRLNLRNGATALSLCPCRWAMATGIRKPLTRISDGTACAVEDDRDAVTGSLIASAPP